MRIILICIFSLGLKTHLVAQAQVKEHINPALKNKTPKEGFNSSETKRQAHYLHLEKKEPAFYSLMAYLHGWETPKSHTKTNELKAIWSKISTGEVISTDEIDIQSYEALIRAKEKYDSLSQDEKNYSLPILPFEAGDMINTMINADKLSLLNKKQLSFYLKLYDRKLVDADMDAVSGNAFAQLFKLNNDGAAVSLNGNTPRVLEVVLELEKEFQIKKNEAGPKKTVAEFTTSPLQLFSASVSARMKEEVSVNPKTKSASLLANSMRKLSSELLKIDDPALKTQMADSLSLAITEVEKNSPKGLR